MKCLLPGLLSCVILAHAQTPTAKKQDVPEVFAVKYVVGAPWEAGELRTCSTYSNHTDFLLCDEDIREAVMVGWMDHKKIDQERLIVMTIPSGKRFLVQFSQLPWKLASPDPDKPTDDPAPVFAKPNPDSRDMESRWDCSKEKVITCKFLKSSDITQR